MKEVDYKKLIIEMLNMADERCYVHIKALLGLR